MRLPVFQAEKVKLSQLQVVNDGVMGGKSQGNVEQTDSGLRFYGSVSLANNGGFSSFRMPFQLLKISEYSAFQIVLKGDGKVYQFRVQESSEQQHAYVVDIPTDQKEQKVEIPFEQLQPQFRGNKLDLPSFQGQHLSRVGFMILPRKAVDFQLLVKEIGLI